MNKPLAWTLGGIAALIVAFYAFNSSIYNEKQGDTDTNMDGSRRSEDFEFTGLIGGGWTWQRTELTGGEVVTAPEGGKFILSFDEDGLVYSTTDCNQLSGSYTKSDDGTIKFSPFAMTKMFCEGSQEGTYAAQLAQTASYTIQGDTLHLVLSREVGVMVFAR